METTVPKANETNETPLEDLKRDALKLYYEGANAIHHYSSFIEKCIKEYQPVDLRPIGKEGIIEVLKKHLYKGLLGNINIDGEIESIATELSEVKAKSKIKVLEDMINSPMDEKEKKEISDFLKSLSEVNPVQSNVTDEEIINFALDYVSHKDLKPANRGLIKDALIIGAKWLRSRLQPADNLTDLINCIKAYDKTAPLEEKGRYFEAIQREFEKIQPAQRITYEQIEKWAESQHPSMTSPIICGYVLGLMDGAKAVLSDRIAEYIKNLK